MFIRYFFFFLLGLVLLSCEGMQESQYKETRQQNRVAEYIYRQSDDCFVNISPPQSFIRQPYKWEEAFIGKYPKITKEFFQCKGNHLHTAFIMKNSRNESERVIDCGGGGHHSLPIYGDKEFIFPVLCDILNFIQEDLGKQVKVTCGHRCPVHNSYADTSNYNRTSKHTIGGEVDFYVEGLENKPKHVIESIMRYYKKTLPFSGNNDYEHFQRYQKPDTNVSTLPWYNKEVFIKLFQADEGRDFDNAHPYPYISIQVRHDRESQQRVSYTWEQAFYGYLRY